MKKLAILLPLTRTNIKASTRGQNAHVSRNNPSFSALKISTVNI